MIAAPVQALCQPIPKPSALRESSLELKRNDDLDPEAVVEWLVKNSFERVDAIDLPGQFARRGGIIDIYAPLASEKIGWTVGPRTEHGEPPSAIPGPADRVLRRYHREHSRDQPRYPALHARDREHQHRGRRIARLSSSSGSCSRISCRRMRLSSSRSRRRWRKWPTSFWPASRRRAGFTRGRKSTIRCAHAMQSPFAQTAHLAEVGSATECGQDADLLTSLHRRQERPAVRA